MTQISEHRCPYCFSGLPLGTDHLACPTADGPGTQNCVTAVPAVRAPGSICPEHKKELVPFCYARGCQRRLPPGWGEVTTTCISMAGTRSSGKTVFVAESARLLQAWGRKYQLIVEHYSKDSKDDFETRFGRLKAGESLFGSTMPEIPGGSRQEHQEPVLLRLKRFMKRDHVLVIRDIAGEDVQNALMDRAHFGFLARADGMILMVDPSDSPQVQRSGLVDQHEASEFDPSGVWGNIERLHAAVVGDAARMVPMAVTISKFDLVLDASESAHSTLGQGLSAKGSRMHQDPSLRTGTFDPSDADLLDSELRSLCDEKYLGHPVLVQWANQAAGKGDVRFFAVSALGQAAKFGRVAKHGIVPYRCLDPWKWFLANAGLIS